MTSSLNNISDEILNHYVFISKTVCRLFNYKKYIFDLYMSILKIVGYTILFIILSPGLLLTFWAGDKGYFMSEQTNYLSIMIHTIIFSTIVVSLEEKKYLDKVANSELTDIDTKNIPPVVAIMLFIVLTPGLLLTIPPESGGLLFSKQTSVVAVFIHTILFIILFVVVSRYVNKNRSYFKIQ